MSAAYLSPHLRAYLRARLLTPFRPSRWACATLYGLNLVVGEIPSAPEGQCPICRRTDCELAKRLAPTRR